MYEIYAYGNVDTLNGIFNAVAAIMGGADYFGLIKAVAITGVLVAAFAGLFTPGRFHGWSWLFGFLFVYYALFLPKVDVGVIDKLGSQPPTVISNVPLGVAFFGHYTSLVGNNEKDTAVALAREFFVSPRNVAISTNRGWQDALTGGAMIGATYGPLLLTDPNQLYGPVANYLSDASGSIVYGVMLGGYLALPDALIEPIGNAIGVPDSYVMAGGATPMANLVPEGEPLTQR